MVAALAIGLVVTYQSSGVVNFAHAALGTYSAFAYFRFRTTGELVLPVLGLPSSVRVPGLPRPTVAAALAVVLVLAAAMGAFLALVVYRPLRRSSPLARMVASLGVLLYLIAMIDLRFPSQGATGVAIEPILPTRIVQLGSLRIPADRFWLAGLVGLTTLVLWALYRHTRFGIATRAVAENERAAVMLGVRADPVSVGNWVIASVLAALAVILAAPVTRLGATSTSLLIVPAIAAALVARFTNLWGAAGAAIAIGMAQSELQNLRLRWDWLPDVGLQQGVPILVIIVALAIGAGGLPARGDLGSVQLPSARLAERAEWFVGAVVAAGLVVAWWGSSPWRSGVAISAIAVVMSLSVVVATGFVGQISLATSAFAGLAAFSLVKLTNGWGLPFPLGPLVASLVAVGFGVLIGLPAVRVRGLTLAMATLAGALAVEQLVFQWSWFTGGVEGTTVEPPRLGGLDLGIAALGDAYPRRAFVVMVVLVAGLATAALVRLRRGATVRRWLAVRGNERAAAALGIPAAQVKLGAFACSAFLAGLAGTLLAYQRQTLSVSSFESLSAIVVLAITYLAGIATPLGAVLAGVLASGGVLTVALGDSASRYQFALNGLLLVVAAIALPDGIVGRRRSATRAGPATRAGLAGRTARLRAWTGRHGHR